MSVGYLFSVLMDPINAQVSGWACVGRCVHSICLLLYLSACPPACLPACLPATLTATACMHAPLT